LFDKTTGYVKNYNREGNSCLRKILTWSDKSGKVFILRWAEEIRNGIGAQQVCKISSGSYFY